MLKWNDHHTLFFVGAEELCESEEYTDVTLAAGSKFFPAHKLVLSICSPYFRQLFKRLGKDKPVIYLKDVDPKHLDLLLQYMYKGEIKVQENELVSVLNTAQGLEIKGLSENSDTPQPPLHNNITKPEQLFSNSTNQQAKRPLPPQGQVPQKRPKLLPTNDIKPSNVQNVAPPGPSSSQNQGPGSFMTPVKQEITPVTIDLDDGIDSTGLGETQGDLSGFEGLGQELAFCDTSEATGYEDIGAYDEGEYFAGMEPHTAEVDRVWFGESTKGQPTCPFCGKTSGSMKDLEKHIRKHTNERPYPCRQCEKCFKDQSNRNRHEKQVHGKCLQVFQSP